MSELSEQRILCPYCNEAITVLVDPSVDYQEYIEDCQVCCRPIEMIAMVDMDGDVSLQVRHEDE
jgi:hypothetical protein